MECECLPFTNVPHASPLFTDFLYRFPRVQAFYPHPPLSRDWTKAQAGKIHLDPRHRQRLADVLDRQNRAWGASPEALANIQRLRDGAAAVVTGQQVGLFGGPAFSIYKALSAVKVAAEFSSAGVDAVPVFWLATEDHDFTEVATAVLPANGGLARITIASPERADVPVGGVTLGEQIHAAVGEAREILGDSAATDLLAECYAPGETMGSAFAKFMGRAFAPLGLICIDAQDAELRELSAPIIAGAIEHASELNRAVRERGKALVAAGYHEQVKVTPSSTFLFRIVDGQRLAVKRGNGGFSSGEEHFSAAELAERARTAPQEFSAAVLLRPIVQDHLLPTMAAIGGPAEVAYFAQSAPLYEALLGRVTPILPRFSATLVEPRVARVLDKYRLKLADIVHAERPAELLARRALPQDLEQKFAAAVEAQKSATLALTASLDQLDHTLVGAANRAGAKMRYQLERLHGRAARAHLRRSETIASHAQQLATALYPDRDLQERVVNGVYFLARYGTELLESLLDVVHTNCPDHKIVRL